MKISNLIKSAIFMSVAAVLTTACSDGNSNANIKPSPLMEKQESQSAVQPDAQLFKVVQEDGCRTYTLERDVNNQDAKDAGVQSPMALCEERLKPVMNSASKDYDRSKVAFTCFRANEAKEIIAENESCIEI